MRTKARRLKTIRKSASSTNRGKQIRMNKRSKKNRKKRTNKKYKKERKKTYRSQRKIESEDFFYKKWCQSCFINYFFTLIVHNLASYIHSKYRIFIYVKLSLI